ncbi:hypothetical protein [Myceligenerans pegani]|uniref:Uncharacterized protein n=1 Tax=Myceligenerans pegani TaxID=2776917 RepID=A0ABR9MWM5_9MICO|nr:hypothetical protein [Myceligenerans sp. TRM 65318]MBE1875788.1 hypothetical protein [Myceligenerans sp. TRM 65318]MBE3018059.1 hypothetical protein [Myceligenerans sp. TRM 65318]
MPTESATPESATPAAETPGETSSSRRLRGWHLWLLIAGIVVAVVIVLYGALLALAGWWFADAGRPEHVDCVEIATAVGREALPEGSTGGPCELGGFQDWYVGGEIRTSREALDAWLADLPGAPELAAEPCVEAIACVQVDLTQEAGDAHYLDVDVLREDGDELVVRLTAFTT